MFNERFGSGITRRNNAIHVPIVKNFTISEIRYNDGTVNPPSSIKNWEHVHASREPLINEEIHYTKTSAKEWEDLDTNPNYKGDGFYFPEYQKHGVLYDYPEWDPKIRQPMNKPRKEYPLEIRRRLYF